MEKRIGKREFLRKAGVAALTVSALLHRTSEDSHAMNGSSTDTRRESKAKTKRVAVEEHWMVPTGKPLQLILGHLGESLPYLLARLDEGYVMAFKDRKLKRLFSEYIKENMVVTTSGKYRPEALVCAIKAMGADRVLFATDYPYVTPKESVQMVESSPISDADKEKIYHLNAERWLKL
jgi:hypothetical protein